MKHTSQFGQSKRKVRRSRMARKIQLLAIILAISISVGYARGPKKIILGNAAPITEFPHQVSLQTETGWHFCGGSIIGAEFILTAAHCLVDGNKNPKKANIDVVVGTEDKERRTPDNVFHVVRRIIHHNFNPADSYRNDIAVLKLNKPIVFNDSAKPAKLPYGDLPAGTRVMSSGWGATTYDRSTGRGDNYPRYLQKLERTILLQRICRESMKAYGRIGPEHICVESPHGADSCYGDSGGPLTYNGEVIGLTSYGIGCGLEYPDIYTRVHHYYDWIKTAQWYLASNLAVPNNSQEYMEV